MMSMRSARRLGLVALTGLSLAACAPRVPEFGLPRAPEPAPVLPEVRLVTAIENAGCVLSADNKGQILLAANMTQDEMQGIIATLAASGRVQVAGEGALRVMTDRCL